MKIEKSISPIFKPFKVRVPIVKKEMWDWCNEHYDKGSWHETFSLTGTDSHFRFDKESDAMLFLLRWAGQ